MDIGPIDLWLDDIRDPSKHGRIGWRWAKTASEAIALLRTGRVYRASLDHDLAVEQTMGQDDGKHTGYTVVQWMEANNVWPSGGVTVHSMNPVGRERMQAVINRAYKH